VLNGRENPGLTDAAPLQQLPQLCSGRRPVGGRLQVSGLRLQGPGLDQSYPLLAGGCGARRVPRGSADERRNHQDGEGYRPGHPSGCQHDASPSLDRPMLRPTRPRRVSNCVMALTPCRAEDRGGCYRGKRVGTRRVTS